MEFVADLTMSVLGIVVVGLYVWSTRAHFVGDAVAMGARLIGIGVIVNTLMLLVLTWTIDQPLFAHLIGFALALGSVALFYAAIAASRQARLRYAYDPAHPHGLVQHGPYRFVRHPFYVSYILFWLGWSIAAWSVFGVITLAMLIALYINAARFEEANFAASPLADDYAAYRQRVGFFFPRLR